MRFISSPLLATNMAAYTGTQERTAAEQIGSTYATTDKDGAVLAARYQADCVDKEDSTLTTKGLWIDHGRRL